jgi:glycosyltransferase involved in cell wall biosynthesis
MRILQVMHGPPDARSGGTGVVVGALAEGLRELGHTVAVLAPEGGELGVRLPALTVDQSWRHSLGLPWLRRQVRRFAPDLVHVHHTSGLPLELGRLVGDCPVVWTFHDYALACVRGQLVDRWGGACPGPAGARCARCVEGRVGGRRAAVARTLEQRLAVARAEVGRGTVRLAPSRHLGRRMAALGFGPVEHCPLPLERSIAPAPEPGSGPLRLLFLGSLLPTKGVELLLQAVGRVQGVELRLVGPVPEWPERPDWPEGLRRRAAAVGAQLAGPCERGDLDAVLAASDVLVLPSLWHENSPLTVREATAAGLRTVLPRQGGARELDPQARLVDNGDLGSLVAALKTERDRGRSRREPLAWPTPVEHAQWMLRAVYARCL